MSARFRRDLRVDLLRGLALLFILWDHIMLIPETVKPFFLMVTPALWGVSSALAIFVFLSGYVYGLVYRRLTRREGTSYVFKKSCDRAWQLYAYHVLTMFMSVGVVGGLCVLLGRSPDSVSYGIANLFHLTPERGWEVVSLQYFTGMSVLPVYIVLLLIAPVVLLLLRRHTPLALGLSFSLYVMAQLGLNLPAPSMGFYEGGWPINPFAWQLLFVIGIGLGWHDRRMLSPSWARAAAGVVVLVAVKIWLLPRLVRSGLPVPSWLIESFPWSDRGTLGPVRLTYFLTLAYATAYYTRTWNARLRSPGWGARLLRVCLVKPGQYSLTVYTTGIVFTFIAIILLGEVEPHWLYTAGAILGAWILSVAVAYLAEARRALTSRPSRTSQVSPSDPAPPKDTGRLENEESEHTRIHPVVPSPGDAPNLPRGTEEETG